jgi:hypothetical protein
MGSSRVAGRKNNSKTYPRLLVCEGYEDYCFFNRLIDTKLVDGQSIPRFHIIHSEGNTNFYNRIDAFRQETPKTFANIKHILFVADNDDTPADQFDLVCNQIERLRGLGTAPSAPLIRKGKNPSVEVLMLPWTNEKGTMEAVCIGAAREAHKQDGRRIDDFMGFIGAQQWTNESRRGKAWLRSNLAIRCEKDPFISMGDAISDPRHQDLIDFTDNSLDRIARVLAKVGR